METINKKKRIEEIESELSKLPTGTLCYKNIKGKAQPYLQSTVNGKSVSYYVKVSEREHVLFEIEKREQLKAELKILKTYSGRIAKISLP